MLRWLAVAAIQNLVCAPSSCLSRDLDSRHLVNPEKHQLSRVRIERLIDRAEYDFSQPRQSTDLFRQTVHNLSQGRDSRVSMLTSEERNLFLESVRLPRLATYVATILFPYPLNRGHDRSTDRIRSG